MRERLNTLILLLTAYTISHTCLTIFPYYCETELPYHNAKTESHRILLLPAYEGNSSKRHITITYNLNSYAFKS
jgi:hypothetical protein